jgi:hypothetical protein
MSSRRRVLLTLITALGTARFASARVLELAAAPEPELDREQLCAALGLTGIDVSALLSHKRTREQLAEVLSGTLSRQLQLRAVSAGELRITLAHLIAEDFRKGALLEIDGWQLARSEAMVLAVLAEAHAPKTPLG